MTDLTLLTADPNTWQDATCVRLGVDPNAMQPDEATHAEVAEAIDLCGNCPLFDLCRERADSQGDAAYGVHAGQWWGDEPVWLVERECAHEECGETFRSAQERPRRFCSPRCRVAAHRARRESVSA